MAARGSPCETVLMQSTTSWAVGGVAIVLTLSLVSLRTSRPEAITPDVAPPSPVVEAPQTVPYSPGVAVPRMTTDPNAKPRVSRSPAKLEQIDPWTGEDLAPEIAVAVLARTRPEVDRHDP